MLFSQSIPTPVQIGERYSRSESHRTGVRRTVAVGQEPQTVARSAGASGPRLDFAARLVLEMAASKTPPRSHRARIDAHPMLPAAGVTTSVRIEGDESVVTERVTERVAVTHLAPEASSADPITRYLGASDALTAASSDWAQQQTPGRIRPHLNYLYAAASSAYMQTVQMRLWVYQ